MSTENLNNQEGIEKIKALVNDIDIGMLSTYSSESKFPHSVPMSRQEVDDEGNIWFLFSAESETYRRLQQDKDVSITYAHVSDYKFLNITGNSEVSTDQSRIDKYWNKFVEAWFEKGKEDPNIRILKVVPKDAYYWDNKTNKLFTLLHIATNAITGNKSDVGREGEINL